MFREDIRPTKIPAAEAASANLELFEMVSAMRAHAESRGYASSAAVVAATELPDLAGKNGAVLLVALSTHECADIQRVLEGEGEVINEVGSDMTTSSTLLRMGNEEPKLLLDCTRLVEPAMDGIDGSIVLVVASNDLVYSRRLVPENLDDFLCILQCAQMGSGSTYRPLHWHLDGQRKKAALTVHEPGVVLAGSFAPLPLVLGIDRPSS